MIHHLNALSVTEKLRESLQDSGDDFQFAALECNLAEYANNVVTWHWHDFVEFVYVTEGEMESCTPRGVMRMVPGDGCFINANVLHTAHDRRVRNHSRDPIYPGIADGLGQYIPEIHRACGKVPEAGDHAIEERGHD